MADNIKINLHTHTNISDGELSPNNLLQVANANEVELFSITDHDTIVHQSDIVRSPNKSKKYIKGVEISVCWNNNVIHLLHYFQDGKMCGELLKKNHKSYIQRSCYLIEQINLLLGLNINPSEIISESPKEYITRIDICRYLVKHRYVKNEIAVYSRIFRKLKDVKQMHFIRLNEIMELNDTGITILAHPHQYLNILPDLLYELKKSGCHGLEFNTGSNIILKDFKEMMGIFGSNCLVSFGTDFHSKRRGIDIVSTLNTPNRAGYCYENVVGIDNLSPFFELSN